jgi:hypothetical protein
MSHLATEIIDIPMLGGEFHLRNLAASVGEACRTARSVSTARWDANVLTAMPLWIANFVWIRPKASVANYLDLWNWDPCDP